MQEVRRMSSGEWDFITEYKSLMNEITDAPDAYLEASALFLISTFAGRKFIFNTAPEVKIYGDEIGGRLLNLWFILIGKTRVARKSTTISKVEEYVEEIAPEILLPKDFTPEALITELSERTLNGVTHAAWIHDEVSQFFEALKKKDYMASTDALLSRIYDGRDYHRSTITRGREVIRKPYLTVFIASTDVLPTYFSELYIRQGFLNRFLYIVADRGKLRPLEFIDKEDVRHELQKLGDEWLKELFLATNVYIFDLDDEAKKFYHEFEHWVDNKILNENLGIKEGFYGNLPNALLKLAGVYHISTMEAHEFKNPIPFIKVNKHDFERAALFLAECEKWFDQVITLMKISPQRRQVVVEEGELEYIKTIIRAHGGEIRLNDLVKEAKMSLDRVNRLIDTLVAAKEVEWVKIRPKGGRGRPSMGVRLIE